MINEIMHIKAPLVAADEVMPLYEAGADEFFCGIEPATWKKSYSGFALNQRCEGANFATFGKLKKAVDNAHRLGVKVHVTINAFFYLEKQYKAALDIMKAVSDTGADGFILSDPVLISRLNPDIIKGKDVVVGCDATVFNSYSARFYKDMGATRIVFPRAMTLSEMKDTVDLCGNMEYEVFIMNDLCFFVDGFCTYCKEYSANLKPSGKYRDIQFFTALRILSRGQGGGCRTGFRKQRFNVNGDKTEKGTEDFSFWGNDNVQGCGACALYSLKKAGITYLKVLDRNMRLQDRVLSTAFIKKCCNMLQEKNITEKRYVNNCIRHFEETFKRKCSYSDCYYPVGGDNS